MTRTVRVLFGIGIAFLTTILAAALRLSLDPFLAGDAPFLAFTFSVFITSIISGLWAGLLCTALALLVGNLLFLTDHPGLPYAAPIQIGMFSVLAVGSSLIAHLLLSSRAKRLAAEDARDRSDVARTIAERQLTQVIERLKGYSVITLSANGGVTSWNRGAELMKGYTEAEALHLHHHHFFGEEDREAGVPDKVLKEAQEKGEARYTTEHVRKGGEVLISDVLLICIENASGAVDGYLEMTKDITRETQLMRELEDLYSKEKAQREEAQRLIKMKDEFLSTISHELRTPLNAILGWAQLLTKGSLSPDLVNDAIETIYRNAKVQVTLVDDLLDMGRIISGKLKISTKRLNLLPVIEAAIDTVRPAALAKEIEIVAEWPYEEVLIDGDSARLQQSFWNLLSNAVKFTPVKGTIWVMVETDSAGVSISVRDTGPGIDEALLPRIFDRFFQVDSSSTRTHGGLGLGLAIVKSLVDLHGGEISVISRKGQGATFVIKLPIASASKLEDVVEMERRGEKQESIPVHTALHSYLPSKKEV